MGNSYVSTYQVKKAFGTRMVNFHKLSFHTLFKNTVQPTPNIFQFQCNGGALENVQIPFSKPCMHADYQSQTTFRAEITTSAKFQFHI